MLAVDGFNPMIAARLVEPLGGWRRYVPALGELMRAQLQRIVDGARACPRMSSRWPAAPSPEARCGLFEPDALDARCAA